MITAPEAVADGVKLSLLPTMLTVPWLGVARVAVVTVSKGASVTSGSVSFASTSMPFFGVLKLVLAISVLAVGTSFTPLILMASVAVLVSPSPSVIW